MKEEYLENESAAGKDSLGDMLMSNLDLVAFVVALILLGLYFAGILFGLPEDFESTRNELKAEVQALKSHLSEVVPDGAAHTAALRAGDDAVTQLTAKQNLGIKLSDNAITYPKELVAQVRAGESNELKFPAPADARGEAGFGANRVFWSLHQDSNVPLEGFVVRRKVGSGSFKDLAEVKAAEFQYSDETVTPGVDYVYRVHSLTKDFAGRGQLKRSAASEPVALRAVADFRVVLISADPKNQTAVFDVEKWHNEGWSKKRFQASAGQLIGAPDTGSGIDYSTQRRLKEVKAEERTETRKRFEVVFDAEGKVRTQDGGPVTEGLDVTETFMDLSAEVVGGSLPPEVLRPPQKR